jgi:hypothetical protein
LFVGARLVAGESRLKKVSEFRKHADECRQMMSSTAADEHRRMLETMAKTWDDLAEDRERLLAQGQRIAELESIESREAEDESPP